jgi:tRNA dimethylallyltransferase
LPSSLQTWCTLKKKKVIVILGPTAVGKTAMAIELASGLGTKIISADSRQCFVELNIGVAKPTSQELKRIRHYFINSHSITQLVNAAIFEGLALQFAREIFTDHDQLIMVGGTGLYIKSFCCGLDEIPVVNPAIRQEVQKGYQEFGLTWLQQEIEKNDPEFYRTGEILNPHRIMRALEVKLSTGSSVRSFHSNQKLNRDFDIIKVGIEMDKDELHRNINARVDQMMSEGLMNEVEQLVPFKNLNALNTVGYTELFDHFDNKYSLDEAVARIKKNTRQYAKRQMTWFKRDESITWFRPDDFQRIKKITEP